MLEHLLRDKRINLFGKLLGCVAIYFALGKIGISLALKDNPASPVWPAAGFALACIYLGGRIYAIPVFFGSLFSNLLSPSVGLFTASFMSLGSMLQGVVGAWALSFIFTRSQDRSWSFPIGFLLTSFISATVSATIGNIALVSGGVIPFGFVEQSWITWWIGDAIGIILVAPILLIIKQKKTQVSLRFKRWKFYLVPVFGLLFNFAIFYKHLPGSFYLLHNLFVFILSLFVGYPLAILYVIAISISSILMMIHGHTPFAIASMNGQLIETQTFIGLMAITALFVERRRFAKLKSSSVIFMSVSWIFATAFLHYLNYSEEKAQDLELAKIKSEITKSIEKTELIFDTALDGGVALFSASTKVTKSDWKLFVDELKIPIKYPGVLGLGVIDKVKQNKINHYLSKMRQEDAESFQLKEPPGFNLESNLDQDLFIISYIEPLEKNRKAQGLVISLDPKRRSGAEGSALLDKTVRTGPISIVQLDKEKVAGLIFQPVYKPNSPQNTPEERMKAVERWIYAPFDFEKLFGSLLNQFEGKAKIEIQEFGTDKDLYSLGEKISQNIATENFKSSDIKMNFFEMPIQVKVTYLQGRPTSTNKTIFIFLLGFSIILVHRIISLLESFKTKAEKLIGLRTEQYREEIEKNNAILQSAHIAIITTNLNGIITGVNQEGLKILEYQEFELVRLKTPLHFHSPIELEKYSLQMSLDRKTKVEPNFELLIQKARILGVDQKNWTYITKSGKQIPVNLSISGLKDQDGDLKGFLFIARDLTEEIEMQMTIDSQQAKLLNSSKLASLGEVAAGIAHEINNPLSIIQGWVELLMINVEKSQIDKKQFYQNLDKIKVATQRAAHIIKSLKSLSRNAEEDPLVPTDVVFIVQEALELFKQRFLIKGINLEVFAPQTLLANGKQSQIMQIMTNLLSNSLDAIQNLEEKWIRINLYQEDGIVKFVISDSGRGIDPKIREKLMQPFFTTKEVGKGTGLGLSISRQIAEQHGGRLYLDTEQKNTCFVLELQLAQKAQKVA